PLRGRLDCGADPPYICFLFIIIISYYLALYIRIGTLFKNTMFYICKNFCFSACKHGSHACPNGPSQSYAVYSCFT
ncbi:hypothetical protein, partial [Komagataeibacter kakiaceti]|uniref:hypothetical protein n=1 Tax=Komagataeibacter kakiaceti TaxID=943261 RepID=UPI001A7EBF00